MYETTGARTGEKEQSKPHSQQPSPGHHRRLGDGAARAAVFGISDGLLSNVSLVLGMAGGTTSVGFVRLAGMAGLLGGAFSMAAGEYVSMRAQAEFLERELELERRELERNPDGETAELAALYRQRGVPEPLALDLAEALMKDPEVALEVHAREELGVDPEELGAPVSAALASFASFAVGALVPLLPWFFGARTIALALSTVLALVAAVAVGALVGVLSGRRVAWSAARQALVLLSCGVVTFGLGRLIGASVA